MSASQYECHITIEGTVSRVRVIVASVGWKFSAIDGDPSLGEGVRCYATQHYSTYKPLEEVIEHMTDVARRIENAGGHVIRKKVEKIVYDSTKE
jgi:hypothetical protein